MIEKHFEHLDINQSRKKNVNFNWDSSPNLIFIKGNYNVILMSTSLTLV